MITKIKNYVKANKAQIITVITGIISLLVAINTNITTSTKVGLFITLATVLMSILLTVVKNGFTDATIDLIVNAIEIIQEIVNGTNTTSANEDSKDDAQEVAKHFTADEIRARLVAKD